MQIVIGHVEFGAEFDNLQNTVKQEKKVYLIMKHLAPPDSELIKNIVHYSLWYTTCEWNNITAEFLNIYQNWQVEFKMKHLLAHAKCTLIERLVAMMFHYWGIYVYIYIKHRAKQAIVLQHSHVIYLLCTFVMHFCHRQVCCRKTSVSYGTMLQTISVWRCVTLLGREVLDNNLLEISTDEEREKKTKHK